METKMIRLSKLSRNIALAMLTGGVIGVSSLAYGLSADEENVIRNGQVANKPMNLSGMVPPAVMLVLGREHNLFVEAYDDASDIDGDGRLDTMYDPSITYEGLFDPKLCYEFKQGTSSLNNAPARDGDLFGYWLPVAEASLSSPVTLTDLWLPADKDPFGRGQSRKVPVCEGSTHWLGNFLNYVTTSRIDAIRKILYGGTRLTDTALTSKDSKFVTYSGTSKDGKAYKATLLKHSRVLRDGHSWGKVLGDAMYGGKLKASQFTGLPSTSENGAYFFAVTSYDSQDSSGPGQPHVMRIVKIDNAGMPMVENSSAKMNIWDWVSRQTKSNKEGGAASSSSKFGSCSGDNWSSFPTGVSLPKVKWDDCSGGKMREVDLVVVACTPDFHSSSDCKDYSSDRDNPEWQPVGLLQQYGEGSKPRINFGLITGSWTNNLGLGTLRANIGDFTKEVYVSSAPEGGRVGDFDLKAVGCKEGVNCGFIKAIDNMNIAMKNHGSNDGSGDYTDCHRNFEKNDSIQRIAKMTNGKCKDWGNPVAKLLYSSVLYFRNKTLPAKNDVMTSWNGEVTLNIGYAEQKDPYTLTDWCAKPVTLLIADENVSFDYNNVWGGADPFKVSGTDDNTNVANALSTVSTKGFKSGKYIVGGNYTNEYDDYYYIPSLKEISSLGDIEGIAPAAAYSHGSYNVAGVAYYFGANTMRTVNVPNSTDAKQHSLQTYVVAMKPNLPEINLHTEDGRQITILPFAKTFGDTESSTKCYTSVKNEKGQWVSDKLSRVEHYLNKDKMKQVRQCHSTNQIADFYVEKIADKSGVFRINYEDFQYGSDYDMDWVVEYDYEVMKGTDGEYYVRIVTRHVDGDPYAPQHAGYLITGVEHEGVYVDLAKSTANSHPDEIYQFYDLDTIINDSNIINCAKGLKYTSKEDFYNDSSCRFTNGGFKTKNDYKLNGVALSASNIAQYYQYITELDGYETDKFGTVNLYYSNRLQIADAMNKVLAKTNDSDCPRADQIPYDRAGITPRCFEGSKSIKRLFGDSVRKNYGLAASRVFKVSKTTNNYWLKSPLWYAARFGLGPVSETVDPNSDTPNNYYEVTNMTKLRDGMAKMLNNINKFAHSGSGFQPAATSKTKTGDLIYPTMYDPSIWKGDVVTAKVSNSGGYDFSEYSGAKKASDGFNDVSADPANRFVFTYDMTVADKADRVRRFYSGIDNTTDGMIEDGAFHYLTCNIIQQILKEGTCTDGVYSQDNTDSRRFMNQFVRWVLGDHSYEGLDISQNASKRLVLNGGGKGSQGTPLRERRDADGKSFVLADIINSNAVYFSDVINTTAEDGTTTAETKGFIVVGANDGMLHFINAQDMKPVLSYIPSAAWGELKQLSRQDYDHFPFVDSTPKIYSRKGHTYVYGTFGLGLKGAYLLDVTGIHTFASKNDEDKLTFARDMLKWELTDKTLIPGAGFYAGSSYVGKYRDAPTLINAGGNENNDKNVPYLLFTSGLDYSGVPGVFIVDMLGENGFVDPTDPGASIGGSTKKCYASLESGEFNKEITAETAADYKLPCVVAATSLDEIQKANKVDITNAFSDPWGLGRRPAYTAAKVINLVGDDADSIGFYFADTFGYVWKHTLGTSITGYVDRPYNWFKCKTGNSACSGDTNTPKVIFIAQDKYKKNQPITAVPVMGYYGGDGIGIIVGTGSYMYSYDSDDVSKTYNDAQSLYMFRDAGSVTVADDAFTGRCEDQNGQHCLKPLTVTKQTETNYRQFNLPNLNAYQQAGNYGWYVDLNPYDPVTGQGPIYHSGERISTNMLVLDNTVIVTPNIPIVGDLCSASGRSSMITIDYINGVGSTDREIKALVNKLSVTIHYNNSEKKSVSVHAGLDNAEGNEEGKDGMGSVDKPHPFQETKNSSWMKLY